MSFSPQLFSLHEMYDTPDYVTTDTSTKSRTNSGNPAPNDSILITVHPSQTLPSQPHLMEETAGEAVAMATSSTPKSRAKSKKRKPGENRTSNQAGKLSSRLRPIAAAGGPFMTASTPTTSRTRPKDPQKSAASHSSPITTLSPQISAMDEINASPNNPSVTTPTKLPGTSEHRQTPTKPNSTRSRALSTPLETVDEIHHTAILPSMDTPRKPPTKPKHPRGAWVNNLWADVSGQMRRLAVITPDLFDGLLLSRSSATGSSLLQEMVS